MRADEFLRQLSQDPEYLRMLAEKEARHARAVQANLAAVQPILHDLRSSGIDVAAIEKLPTHPEHGQRAVEILLKWLPAIENVDVKLAIVRALSVPWAKPVAAPLLIATFENPSSSDSLRWAIGNALSIVADESAFEAIVSIVTDTQFGVAREMVVLSLAAMPRTEAIPVLIKLLEDAALTGHAVIALRQLRATEARDAIEAVSHHKKRWVRTEAMKALAAIDREIDVRRRDA